MYINLSGIALSLYIPVFEYSMIVACPCPSDGLIVHQIDGYTKTLFSCSLHGCFTIAHVRFFYITSDYAPRGPGERRCANLI